ncbi:MAG: hypothetical protein JO007_03780 [Alphaproteobacteria bacterium]|nr:hypothetical protein [Alphaproteobacteria bacterium]
MPLDGTEMFENPALAKLWEVECTLATEDQWCKGRLHDRRGRHCLVGAITEANARQELTRPIIRAIKEVSGKHYWRIESFNDDPATNHQDVLRVLQRARLILLSELANADQPRAWYLKLYDKIVTEVFGIQSSDYSGFGLDSAPAPVRVKSAHVSYPDEHALSSERLSETTDLFQ